MISVTRCAAVSAPSLLADCDTVAATVIQPMRSEHVNMCYTEQAPHRIDLPFVSNAGDRNSGRATRRFSRHGESDTRLRFDAAIASDSRARRRIDLYPIARGLCSRSWVAAAAIERLAHGYARD